MLIPVAGRLADAGHTRRATIVALGLAAVSFVPVLLIPGVGVAGLVATGVLLDFAAQMNRVLGQRAIYVLDAYSRNRLNSIYMTSLFVGAQSVRRSRAWSMSSLFRISDAGKIPCSGEMDEWFKSHAWKACIG